MRLGTPYIVLGRLGGLTRASGDVLLVILGIDVGTTGSLVVFITGPGADGLLVMLAADGGTDVLLVVLSAGVGNSGLLGALFAGAGFGDLCVIVELPDYDNTVGADVGLVTGTDVVTVID